MRLKLKLKQKKKSPNNIKDPEKIRDPLFITKAKKVWREVALRPHLLFFEFFFQLSFDDHDKLIKLCSEKQDHHAGIKPQHKHYHRGNAAVYIGQIGIIADIKGEQIGEEKPAGSGENCAGNLFKETNGNMLRNDSLLRIFGTASFFGGSVINKSEKQSEQNEENDIAVFIYDLENSKEPRHAFF